MTLRPHALMFAILSCLLAGSAGAAPAPGRLRCMDPRACRLLSDALRQSPTVRGLAARIDDSDLIVFVQMGVLQGELAGSTRLMSSVSGARYVVSTIDPKASPQDLMGRLGHELRHVVEIADAPRVTDDAAMRALFKRIGWQARLNTWETRAAIETGRQVTNEAWERPIRSEADLARAR